MNHTIQPHACSFCCAHLDTIDDLRSELARKSDADPTALAAIVLAQRSEIKRLRADIAAVYAPRKGRDKRPDRSTIVPKVC